MRGDEAQRDKEEEEKLISISSGIVCGLSTIESTGLLCEINLRGCFEIVEDHRRVTQRPLIPTDFDES